VFGFTDPLCTDEEYGSAIAQGGYQARLAALEASLFADAPHLAYGARGRSLFVPSAAPVSVPVEVPCENAAPVVEDVAVGAPGWERGVRKSGTPVGGLCAVWITHILMLAPRRLVMNSFNTPPISPKTGSDAVVRSSSLQRLQAAQIESAQGTQGNQGCKRDESTQGRKRTQISKKEPEHGSKKVDRKRTRLTQQPDGRFRATRRD
jgi:hypothetical protein